MAEKELRVLKLDEMANLIFMICVSLFAIILLASFIQYGFWDTFVWGRLAEIGVISVCFLFPVICIISGIIIMILSKLNFVKTDGNWGTLDLMKSVYSELYPEYFKDEK